MSASKFELPSDFLTGPGPTVQVERIDFLETPLAEASSAALFDGCWAVILDNVLTADECEQLVAAAEQHNNGVWERAMVNIGGGRQAMSTDIRKCGRIIWDDADVAKRIWARCEEHVPEIKRLEAWPKVTGYGPSKRKEIWDMTRLNERMRFLKYGPSEYFKPHCDGSYQTEDGIERSYFTLHLYLDDETSDPADPLKGGATAFHSDNMVHEYNVYPKIGRVLLFQHAYLLHSGAEVEGGTKLTMRTDVMFRRSEEVSTKTVEGKKTGRSYFWSSTLG